jgi:hypothetical protein
MEQHIQFRRLHSKMLQEKLFGMENSREILFKI